MKRSLQLIMAVLTALVLPALGWAGFEVKTVTVEADKTAYTIDDLINLGTPPSSNHTANLGEIYIPVTVTSDSGELTIKFAYTNGSWAGLIADIHVYKSDSGCYVKTHENPNSSGLSKLGTNGTYTTTITGLDKDETYLLVAEAGVDYGAWDDNNASSNGSIELQAGAEFATGTFKYTDDDSEFEFYSAVPYRELNIANGTLEIPLVITNPEKVSLTVKHVSGSHRVEITGLDLYTLEKELIASINQTGYAGTAISNNTFAITEYIADYTDEIVIASLRLSVNHTEPSHIGRVEILGAKTYTNKRQKITYTLSDLTNVNTPNSNDGTYGHGIFNVPIRINSASFTVGMKYVGGGARSEVYGFEIYDNATGELIAAHATYEKDADADIASTFITVNKNDTGFTGSDQAGNTYDFTVGESYVGKFAVVRFYAGLETGASDSYGNIILPSGAEPVTVYWLDDLTVPDKIVINGVETELDDGAKAALLAIAKDKVVSITEVVPAADKTAAEVNNALQVFNAGVVTIDGTIATVDWDFGISAIERDGDNVTITAQVLDTDENEETSVKFAEGVKLMLIDGETPIGEAVTPADNGTGTATFTVPLTDLITDGNNARTFKVKATNETTTPNN